MRTRTGFAVVLTVVLVALSVILALPFLNYLLAGALLAFVLAPVHDRLAPVVGARLSALGLVAAVMVLVLAPLFVLVQTVVGDLPAAFAATEQLEAGLASLERAAGVDLGVDRLASEFVDRIRTAASQRATSVVEASLHAFLGVLLTLFLLYYLLKDGDEFVDWVQAVTPLPAAVQDDLYGEAEATTWAVLKGHVFVAFVQGLVSGIGLFATGVPDAGFWTAAMMVLAMVPIVGVSPVLGGAALYLLLQGRPVAAVGLVIYGMTVVAITDDYLRALVIDHESSLNSAVVLVGVFGAAYTFGPIGIFLGPVLLGLTKATIEVFAREYDVGPE